MLPRPLVRSTPRPWIVFSVAWGLLAALSAMWSLATPISASPDEPAHMIKAASVVRGQFIGEPTELGSEVQVPQYIAYTHGQTCYAMNGNVSAGCIPDVPGNPAEIVTSRTTAGLYNPVYYLLVGWPTLIFQDSTGVFAMRFVSGILSSLFLALSAMMVATWSRRMLPLIALGVAITPMVLFLSGSVNPNALEISATLAAFTGLLSIVMQPNPALVTQRVVIVSIASALAANARGLSPLWLAVALLAPLLLATRPQIAELWKTRAVKIGVVSIAIAVGFALTWLRISNSLSPAVELPVDERPGVPYLGENPIVGFALMLTKTVGHFNQMVGVFGWLDTPVPVEVYSIWVLFVGSLLLWAVATQRGKPLRLTLVLLSALIFLPALAQAAFITNGGWIWQGRYALPVLAILVLGTGAILAERFEKLTNRTVQIVLALSVIAWSIGQFLSFGAALHRYAVGVDGSWPDLLRGLADWVPPTGIVPSLLIFGVTLAITALATYRLAVPGAVTVERHTTLDE